MTRYAPAVGAAVALTGQAVVAGPASATPAPASPVVAGTNVTIAPALQPDAAKLVLSTHAMVKKYSRVKLAEGMTNGHVLEVQKRVGMFGKRTKMGADGAGTFGPRTKREVKRYQRSRGLTADGVVGVLTWAELRHNPQWKSSGTKTRPDRANRSYRRPSINASDFRSSSARTQRVLSAARSKFGLPYLWGGDNTGGEVGFDCSGYVKWVYKQVGKTLPRQSGQIYYSSAVRRISKSQAQEGDLFFVRSGGRIHHVGIIGKNGMWYEALKTGTRVRQHKPWASGSKVLYARVK